jgi:hypothetical protein
MIKTNVAAFLFTVLAGSIFVSGHASAATVTEDYTLTFTGTDGTKAGGTGTLVINETTPINSFTENSAGDLVSLSATVSGYTFTFVPSAVTVDLGTNQTFYSLSGESTGDPGVGGLSGSTLNLNLGGFTFNILDTGHSNLDDGTFTIGPGVIASTPLPATLPLLAGGVALVFYLACRGKKSAAHRILAAA